MQHLHPVSNNKPKGRRAPYRYFLFFLLFQQRKRRFPRTHVCRGRRRRLWYGPGVVQAKSCLAGKQTTEKLSCQSLSNQFLNFFGLSSSNDPALYGKPVRGGTNSWLVAPLLCFESAQQLKRVASSRDKVSCRKQRRQQAAEVPHSALAARAPAPTSSL